MQQSKSVGRSIYSVVDSNSINNYSSMWTMNYSYTTSLSLHPSTIPQLKHYTIIIPFPSISHSILNTRSYSVARVVLGHYCVVNLDKPGPNVLSILVPVV